MSERITQMIISEINFSIYLNEDKQPVSTKFFRYSNHDISKVKSNKSLSPQTLILARTV